MAAKRVNCLWLPQLQPRRNKRALNGRGLASQARESITAALIIVRSSRRIGYSVDGMNCVRNTTQRSSTGLIQNAVEAVPPHQNSLVSCPADT